MNGQLQPIFFLIAFEVYVIGYWYKLTLSGISD
jgi:hypothetical protein